MRLDRGRPRPRHAHNERPHAAPVILKERDTPTRLVDFGARAAERLCQHFDLLRQVADLLARFGRCEPRHQSKYYARRRKALYDIVQMAVARNASANWLPSAIGKGLVEETSQTKCRFAIAHSLIETEAGTIRWCGASLAPDVMTLSSSRYRR